MPLYNEREARDTFPYFKPVSFNKTHRLSEEFEFTIHRAGHILGASFIRISGSGGKSILFSGDIGRLNDPVMKAPAAIQDADYLVVESTYGDRLHVKNDPTEDIERIVNETAARGGTLVIPAFAVGRAQIIMFYIHKLKTESRIPINLPVFLDSPMAINASDLLCKHSNDHRMPHDLCMDVCGIAKYTRTVKQSKDIYGRNNTMPKIIISASGMATGGRVLHHLKNYIDDARNTVLLPGFQARGTRGDRLASGEKKIKIHVQMFPVRAQVVKLDNMSAHADYKEILSWMSNIRSQPSKVFVVHGEPSSAQSMKNKIEKKFGWNTEVPEYAQAEEL